MIEYLVARYSLSEKTVLFTSATNIEIAKPVALFKVLIELSPRFTSVPPKGDLRGL
jgi:hypothetical protein